MTTEVTTVEAWLYSLLSGDAVGVDDRVYDSVALRDAQFPFVIFQFQGGHDVFGVGPARIMTSGLWVVKAVAKTLTFSDLKDIAGDIDEVLQAASGTVTDGTVLACVREQPFKMVENQDGVEYRHLGGMYRVLAQ